MRTFADRAISQPDAARIGPPLLARRVRAGRTGLVGKVPMPATGPAQLGDADRAAVIDHILKR